MIDINHHLVCGEKRALQMLDCADDVSFHSALLEKEGGLDHVISCLTLFLFATLVVSSLLLPQLFLRQNVCLLSLIPLPPHLSSSLSLFS